MGQKEARVLFLFALFIIMLGCGKETATQQCPEGQVMIGYDCCYDIDSNSICDTPLDEVAENERAPAVCGDGTCDNETENCTNCWKDCGACKQIVYIYVPRNFTLAEIQADLNSLERDGIKFRKDINNLNNVSNFLYFDKVIPRYIAEFLDIKYKFLSPSRDIVLNNIFNEDYYVNSSEDLLRYVNASNWYLTHGIRIRETQEYDNRIILNRSLADYPTQPTGYKKEHMYEGWEYRNYTKDETVYFNNVTLLDNGMVEALYAAITAYDITYKSSEYVDKDPDDPTRILEDFTDIEEVRLGYTHSMSFMCARNLVITIYNYDYNKDYYGDYYQINPDILKEQIPKNRQSLIQRANRIKAICDKRYSREVFIYT
ncbi:hypothetical protein KY363_01685 [Candidatus Woesearchaeota archaeon]|nr:hypothetical protein [Candidatus Woesearchaeota archaeon]